MDARRRGARAWRPRWRRPGSVTWWASFAVLFLLGALWSLASPLFSAPDEPSHVVKAAAVARGQLHGRDVPGWGGILTEVEVPQVIAYGHQVPFCYAFKPDVPADCAPAYTGSDETVTTATNVGRYPPVYYFIVGLPSLVTSSAVGVRLMRLASVAIAAALLASAFTTAREWPTSRALILGLAFAVTPMALYLAGTVNPSAMEVAAGVGLWTSLVVLLGAHAPQQTDRLAVRVAVSAVALVASRPASLLWFGLTIVVAAVALANRTHVRSLAANRTVRRAAVAVVVAALLAGAWVLHVDALEGLIPVPGPPPDASSADVLLTSLGKTGTSIAFMVGLFGWLDTRSPLLTYLTWYFGVGLLLLVAMARSSWRQLVGLGGLVLATVVVPVALEASRARTIGFGWQGRYTLPLAVGIPVLAAALVGDSLAPLGRRLVRGLALLVAAGHLLAFLWAFRRYTWGAGEWFQPLGWEPPLPTAIVLLGFAGAVGLYGWWLQRLATPDSPHGG